MTHDSDQDIYLGGYGRRSGLGPEFFAKGLLQAPDHPMMRPLLLTQS